METRCVFWTGVFHFHTALSCFPVCVFFVCKSTQKALESERRGQWRRSSTRHRCRCLKGNGWCCRHRLVQQGGETNMSYDNNNIATRERENKSRWPGNRKSAENYLKDGNMYFSQVWQMQQHMSQDPKRLLEICCLTGKLWSYDNKWAEPGLLMKCTVIFQCDNYSSLPKIVWSIGYGAWMGCKET